MYKFYKTLTEEDAIDHKQSNYDPANPYTYRRWYHEDIQDKDTLLITVGDSWTWGDHLGCIDWDKASDDPVRLTQIYGRKLADHMGADWVNIARPGCSNYWMLEKLEAIQPFLYQYKSVHIVITLTEDLREARYNRSVDLGPIYKSFADNSATLKDFLVQVERYLFNSIETIVNRHPTVHWYVARAFTDVWEENKRLFLLDKTWCDVIQDKIQFDRYFKVVPFVGQMATGPLNDYYMKTEFKEEFLEIMQLVEYRWNFLGASEYNLKGSTYHPNPAGHQLWAEYLFSKMQ